VNPTVVAVVQGGSSTEHEVSVRGARRVRAAFESLGYKALTVELNHTVVEVLRQAKPDFVFVVAHGGEGEGGGLQSILEILDIPFTGSDSLASTLCMNKVLTKRMLTRAGLPTPEFHAFSRELFTSLGAAATLGSVEEKIQRPLVVKPANGGSSVGLRVVAGSDELRPALLGAIAYDDEVLVERYIEGRELAVTILGDCDTPQVLPIVEITPDGGIYDYGAHYEFGVSELAQAELPTDVAQRVVDVAAQAYRTLGCRDIARVDMILDGQNDPQILELNTSPGLTETGPTPFAADLAGMSFVDLVLATARRAQTHLTGS
jgi:D-alanine-D-alanine ligase